MDGYYKTFRLELLLKQAREETERYLADYKKAQSADRSAKTGLDVGMALGSMLTASKYMLDLDFLVNSEVTPVTRAILDDVTLALGGKQ